MRKTNIGLVENSKNLLNKKAGYVWGTFGTILTPTLFNQKLKQYPSGVGNYKDFIQQNWMGRLVTDCVGTIKSYLFLDENGVIKYNPSLDMSADMMFKRASIKGDINTIPEIQGLCVRFKGHVGVYIGNGEVIEAKGTKYGVVKTKLSKGKWTHWYKCPYIEYIEDKEYNIDFLGKKANVRSLKIENGISKAEVRDLFETLGLNVGYEDGMIIVRMR